MNEEQSPSCIKARLVATREGAYVTYVFQNVDTNEYVMCTKCPNWNISDLDFGQEGFLTYKFVCGGRDTWYNVQDGKFHVYKYSANYFDDFVPITHVINGNMIVEKEKLIMT